ncbi:MAG TPA: hypothetical protein PLE48_14590 [Thiobacillus sp.]|nr:hypothetical protein [Acidovorax defluvii]HQT71633.1 hypothetical protein [Thiobacillus sp.]
MTAYQAKSLEASKAKLSTLIEGEAPVNQDTTPTSGAADLPEALRSIQRFEVVDCIDEKHVPAVIPKPHGPWVRYEDHIAALAAGQATAAKGVAYAALPDEREAFESWLRSVWTAGYGCPKFDSGKYVHGEAQRFWECWQARTSHGQAPATAQADSVLYDPKAVLEIFNSARAGSDKPLKGETK